MHRPDPTQGSLLSLHGSDKGHYLKTAQSSKVLWLLAIVGCSEITKSYGNQKRLQGLGTIGRGTRSTGDFLDSMLTRNNIDSNRELHQDKHGSEVGVVEKFGGC